MPKSTEAMIESRVAIFYRKAPPERMFAKAMRKNLCEKIDHSNWREKKEKSLYMRTASQIRSIEGWGGWDSSP
jgi:hypothetical protein